MFIYNNGLLCVYTKMAWCVHIPLWPVVSIYNNGLVCSYTIMAWCVHIQLWPGVFIYNNGLMCSGVGGREACRERRFIYNKGINCHLQEWLGVFIYYKSM